MPESKIPLGPGSQHNSPARVSRIRAKSNTFGLSEVIKSTPNCFDGVKIALVDRGIGELDLVPRRYQETKTLFLSNNSIKDLAGISQFPNLQSLSLAYNKITDYDTLDYLSICKNLQTLSLEGNSVTKLPFYKSRVIQLLPNLVSLDRQTISNQEKQIAQKHVDCDSRLMGILLFCEYNSLALSRYIQIIYNNIEVNNVAGILKKRKILEATILLARMPQEIDSKEWVAQTSNQLRVKVGSMMDIATPFQKSIIVLIKYYINAYVKCIKEGFLKNADMLLELCEKAEIGEKNQLIDEIHDFIAKVKGLDENSLLESNSMDSTTCITTLETLHEELETEKMKIEKEVNFTKIISDMEYILNNLAETDESVAKLTVVPQTSMYHSQNYAQSENRNNDQSVLNINTLRTTNNSRQPMQQQSQTLPMSRYNAQNSISPSEKFQTNDIRSQQNVDTENAILSTTVEEYQKVAETNAIKALKLEADYKAKLQNKEDEIKKQESVLNDLLSKNKNLEEQINKLNMELNQKDQDIQMFQDNIQRLKEEKNEIEETNTQLKQKEYELIKIQRRKEASKILASFYEFRLKSKTLEMLKLNYEINRYENNVRQEIYQRRISRISLHILDIWRRQLYIKKLTELNGTKQASILKKSAIVQWVVFTRVNRFIKESRELSKKRILKTVFERWNNGLHIKNRLERNEKIIHDSRLNEIIENRFKHWRSLTNTFWISKNNYKNNQRILRADEFHARLLETTALKAMSLKLDQIKKAQAMLQKQLENKKQQALGWSFTLFQTAYRIRVQENNRKAMVGELFSKNRKKNILRQSFDKLLIGYREIETMVEKANSFQTKHNKFIKQLILKNMISTHKHILSLANFEIFAHRLFEVRRRALVFKAYYQWKNSLSEKIEQKLENIQTERDERKEVLRHCLIEWRRFIETQKSITIYSQALRLEQARKDSENSKNTIAEIELARLDTVDKLNALIQEHSEVSLQLKDRISKIGILESTMKELVVTNNAYKSESALMKSTIERLKAENSQYRNKLYAVEEAQTAQTATANTEIRVKIKEIDDLKAQLADKDMQIERMEKQLQLEREGMKMEIDAIMQSNERLRERAKQALNYQSGIGSIQQNSGTAVPSKILNESYRDNYSQQNAIPFQHDSQEMQQGSINGVGSTYSIGPDILDNNNSNNNNNNRTTFSTPQTISQVPQISNLDPSVLMKIGAIESNMNNVILKKNIENSKLKKENEMARNLLLDKIPAIGTLQSMQPKENNRNNESIFDGMTNESNGILGSIINDRSIHNIEENDTNSDSIDLNVEIPRSSSAPPQTILPPAPISSEYNSYNSGNNSNKSNNLLNGNQTSNLKLSSIPIKQNEQSYYMGQTLRPSQLVATRSVNQITNNIDSKDKLNDINNSNLRQMGSYKQQPNVSFYDGIGTYDNVNENDQPYQAVSRNDLTTFGGRQSGMDSIEDEIAALQKKIMSRLE